MNNLKQTDIQKVKTLMYYTINSSSTKLLYSAQIQTTTTFYKFMFKTATDSTLSNNNSNNNTNNYNNTSNNNAYNSVCCRNILVFLYSGSTRFCVVSKKCFLFSVFTQAFYRRSLKLLASRTPMRRISQSFIHSGKQQMNEPTKQPARQGTEPKNI